MFGACEEGAGLAAVANVGSPAPEFLLTDLDGKTVNLYDLRHKKDGWCKGAEA